MRKSAAPWKKSHLLTRGCRMFTTKRAPLGDERLRVYAKWLLKRSAIDAEAASHSPRKLSIAMWPTPLHPSALSTSASASIIADARP